MVRQAHHEGLSLSKEEAVVLNESLTLSLSKGEARGHI